VVVMMARSNCGDYWGTTRTISGHPGVWSVVSPNGHIASSGQDKTIKIWRLDTGKQLALLGIQTR